MSISNESINNDIDNIRDTERDSPTNKRKRDALSDEKIDLDRRPFAIRPDSSNPFAAPQTFIPQCLLPRSQLPLAYLDTAQDGSRLFVASVHILEACHTYGQVPSILIVEDGSEKRLYAIERVQRRKYALCRLAKCVIKDEILGRAVSDFRPLESLSKRRALEPSRESGQPWWKAAAVDFQQTAVNGVSTMPTLSLRHPELSETAEQQVEVRDTIPDDSLLVQPTSLDDTLQELARQYLDALYLSRTPLAYFVKGPLARTRAAFSTHPADLISFLRGTVLTSATMDKKFRDVLLELVKDFAILDTPGTKPKRKRKWKSKRDKQGLFVGERDHIEQWWQKMEGTGKDSVSHEPFEAALRRRAQAIRIRETSLQVIIIMEILALEASTPLLPAVPALDGVQDPGSQPQENRPADLDKKQRKKKDSNMTAILETLIERLNIFYTLESSPVKTREDESGSTRSDTKDELRTFATEVIIPFFASRIYEIANSTSKKLGGPSAPRAIDKSSTAAPTCRKPGEPTIRQPSEKKVRKPLGRTSTDTLNKVGKNPPGLHTSVTDLDALATLIKRENSETPSLSLQNIEATQGILRKRTTALDQYAARHKQIDLSAMSQNLQQKAAKNKSVEDKILRDALNGIRKPNRALATEETARNADESFARALARGKPSKSHTQRNAGGWREAKTITATPRHVKATPAPRRRAAHPDHTLGEDGSGSTAVVPSTATRHPSERHVVPGSTFTVPQTGHRHRQQEKKVVETPSRGFAKFMPVGLASEPGTLLHESPTLSRGGIGHLAVGATPMKRLRMSSLTETPISKWGDGGGIIQCSPAGVMSSVQQDDSAIGLSSSFSAMVAKGGGRRGGENDEATGTRDTHQGKSISDALGWNDDDDDDDGDDDDY